MTRWDMIGLRAGNADWTVELQGATDKAAIQRIIDNCQVGDIHSIDAELRESRQALEGSRAGYRHVVLVTDGGGNVVPSDAAIALLREAGITLSICVIEPRGGNTNDLRRAAQRGGGNFYIIHPDQNQLVPQVITKESVRVKKGLYFEERFQPKMVLDTPVLEGIRPGEIPALRGYNVTSKKNRTEIPLLSNHDDVVLAHWQYGLGKSLAFTGDAAGRWGSEWVAWPKFRQFWGQAVRHVQRRLPASPYQLTLQRGKTEGTAEAVIDAVDQDGKFVNFLDPAGTLVRPDLESRPLSFSQVGPGRYKAVFPAEKAGGYVVNVRYRERGGDFLLRGGYVPPYQAEYRRFEDNEALLAAVAERTGGRVIRPAPGVDWFAPTAEVAFTSRLLWPALLALACILVPLDVFLRRVIIGPRDVVDMARSAVGKVIPKFAPRRDAVKEALEAERAAIRASWSPAVDGEVAAESAEVGVATVEAEPVAEVMTANRLREAKERAKRKFDKRL
jgi:hypothetical protein